jgi:hypothetical protein
MSLFETISQYATAYRARRRRYLTYLEISSLPREIQKDIGWPDAFQGSSFRSGGTTRARR